MTRNTDAPKQVYELSIAVSLTAGCAATAGSLWLDQPANVAAAVGMTTAILAAVGINLALITHGVIDADRATPDRDPADGPRRADPAPFHTELAGLDYAAVGPEHAWLRDLGRAESGNARRA